MTNNRKYILIAGGIILLLITAVVIFIVTSNSENSTSGNTSSSSTVSQSDIDTKYADSSDPEVVKDYEFGKKLKQMKDQEGYEPVATIEGESIIGAYVGEEKWRYENNNESIPSDEVIIRDIAKEKLQVIEAKKAGFSISNEQKRQNEILVRENFKKNEERNNAYAAGQGITKEEQIQNSIQDRNNSDLISLWRKHVFESFNNNSIESPGEPFTQKLKEFQVYVKEIQSSDYEHTSNTALEYSEKNTELFDVYIECLLNKSDFKIL